MHETAATICKFVSTFPSMNKSAARTMQQKYKNKLRQAEKEQCEPKQLIANKKQGNSLLLSDINRMVQDYLRISESLSP